MTDLIGEPLLLSIGLVTGEPTNLEFYAEVTDGARIGSASAFAPSVVLPQFGKVADAACACDELGARLATLLDNLAC